MKKTISLASKRLYIADRYIDNPDTVSIPPGVTAVVGPNGAGKSTLGDILAMARSYRTNRIVTDDNSLAVAKIEFGDIHSLAGGSIEYYQQRYEATANDEIPTVSEALGGHISSSEFVRWAVTLTLPDDIADRRLNSLSSGELRKLLIANTVSRGHCDLLILDNAYIGLDRSARAALNVALQIISKECSVMLLLSDPYDIPLYTDTIIPVVDMRILPPIDSHNRVNEIVPSLLIHFDYAVDTALIGDPPRLDNEPVEIVARLHEVTIAHGDRTVIDRLSWIVNGGENWGLSGPNGSGKSTLLSLLTADNPRAYSLDVTLFDRKRGTGESIWDIKRRVAFVSPELALHFNPSGNILTIIAGALNDTSGLYMPITPGQERLARHWMSVLHIESLAPRRWSSLSSGERQMVLLARVFIKQSRLIILDEPFHALDYTRKRAVRAIINFIAARGSARPTVTPVSIIVVSHDADDLPECLTHYLTLK